MEQRRTELQRRLFEKKIERTVFLTAGHPVVMPFVHINICILLFLTEEYSR